MGSIRVEAGLGCDLGRPKSASGLSVLLLRAFLTIQWGPPITKDKEGRKV